MERLRDLGRGAQDNPDAALGIAIAATAAILGLIGVLSDDGLSEAVLGVLLVVGVGLFLDRQQRDQLAAQLDGVSENTERLEAAIAMLERGDSYEVLSSEATWEIVDYGTKVVGSKKRTLRFLRDHQVAITDFSLVDAGFATNPLVEGPFEFVRSIYDKTGTKHALIALDRAYGEGDTLVISLRRAFLNSFLSEVESVSHRIEVVTREVVMRVVWPINRVPVGPLQLTSALDPSLNRTVPLEALDVEPDGRWSFAWLGRDLGLGDRITIAWRW
jgi:hypothetical protein